MSQRLVLFGGGTRPFDARYQFVQWAGGTDAQILVIPWARPEDKFYESTYRAELEFAGAKAIKFAPSEFSPNSRIRKREKTQFLLQLN
jgi:hypothetical protein